MKGLAWRCAGAATKAPLDEGIGEDEDSNGRFAVQSLAKQ